MTALQSFRLYKGDLSGKTVFIPAGCMFSFAHITSRIDKRPVSGTGSYAIQLAKNVFGAKVITTVSTAKVPLIKELLGENTIDESQSSSQAGSSTPLKYYSSH
jgi:hypothetical protein